MDDDSWIARSVLGATLSVSLGLFTVALCHYLGVARLMLALSSTEYTWHLQRWSPAVEQAEPSLMGMGPLGVRCTEMVWNAPTMNLLYVHWRDTSSMTRLEFNWCGILVAGACS